VEVFQTKQYSYTKRRAFGYKRKKMDWNNQ
jgi:hypothetical protein